MIKTDNDIIDKIHDEAIKNIDKRGEELLLLVEEYHEEIIDENHFSSDFHISHQYNSSDNIKLNSIIKLTNSLKGNVGFYFKKKGVKQGIFRENYKQLLKVIDTITKIRAIKDKASKSAITNYSITWIEKKINGKYLQNLSDFIIVNLKKEISIHELWLPIKFLEIEDDITIGNIIFKKISKQFVDNIEHEFIKKARNEQLEFFKEIIKNYYREFQGYAAATLSIECEPIKAKETIISETKRSLSVLRLFSLGCLKPQVSSQYEIWGSENIERIIFFSVKDGLPLTLNDQFSKGSGEIERISTNKMDSFKNAGLTFLSHMLTAKERTQFQKNILDAVFIYSRCATTSDPTDKLVYIFASLEGLFLKNNTE